LIRVLDVKFLADENFPVSSIALLRTRGFDVASIREDSRGVSDDVVLQRAVSEQRILLTLDRDYGELIFSQGHQAPPAVVYFRTFPSAPDQAAVDLLDLIADGTVLLGMFTTISRGMLIRRRELS
jgi:predicted nuclease of predicted toxin-antitoxin system